MPGLLDPAGQPRAAETRGAPRWPRAALLRALEVAAAAEGAVLSWGSAAMAVPAREELVALAAIFCGPDEWEVLSRSGDCRARGLGWAGWETGRLLLPAAETGLRARGAHLRTG